VPVTEAASTFAASTPWHVVASGNTDKTNSLVSVGVNLDPFFTAAGHTTGMAVDADGTFHPTWHSNQTGVMQLWTATIKVDGAGVKNGATDIADLEDISKSVRLDVSKVSFDRESGTLTMTAQLRNMSKDTVVGPIKVRVLTLESGLGVPEIINADNGEHGTGAVWDFASTLPNESGSLTAMQSSAGKPLRFHLTDLRSFGAWRELKSNVMRMDTRVYGKVRKQSPKADDKK
jgi:hypothetical protein